jgi:hypothetical protein
VVSLVELIRLLKGEPIPQSKVAKEGGIVLDFSNADLSNSTVIVAPTTAQMYRDPIARRSIEKVLKPLETEGIDEFEVHKNDQMIQHVTSDEVRFFRTSGALLEQQDNYEGDREGNFSIVTASFEGHYKWRLFDGHARFTADIADEDFLQRVNAGEKFGKGDVLVGTLHIRQWRDENGLHAEYRITHVASIQSATKPKQLPLR